MLRPSKHSHPDRTIVNVALILLARLRRDRLEDFSSLRSFVKKNVTGGEVLFLPAINVLYLLGLVEYRAKIDAFEYRGPNETV
jgi:hypothetical protein